MIKHKRKLSPKPVGVMNIPTEKLQPNPYNPRMLFDKVPLLNLKESIKNNGILVPLTVYQRKSDGKFFILDGQRRWICADILQMPSVPVNLVAEPSLVQNIITMFQIHKLRADWELMPTALKLQLLMKKMNEESEKKLAEFTGLDTAVVTRCKKLLSYSKEFQDMMLDPDPEKRIKADFFIELYSFLHDRTINRIVKYSHPTIIRKMLKKYIDPVGGIKAVTDFRRAKQHIANARKAGKLSTLSPKLVEFVDVVHLTPEHLLIPSADVSAQARSLYSRVEKLREELSRLDVEAYIGEEKLWKALELLLQSIRKCFEGADRRIKN